MMNGMEMKIPGSHEDIDEIVINYQKDIDMIYVKQEGETVSVDKFRLQGLINALYAVQNLVELEQKDGIQYQISVSR